MKPTWVNRAGRIDRSACMEVRASEVKSRAKLRPIRRARASARGKRKVKITPHVEAVGEVEINGRLLAHLHSFRMPYTLAGDGRTGKSNAMKDPEEHNTRMLAGGWPRVWHFNPNKGASRTKLLGFFAEPEFMSGWSQKVRLVRWRSHERLAQHYLICPQCKGKFRKLFMVLCSKQEIDDAATAEAWVDMVDARHAASRRPIDPDILRLRAKMIDRYAPLFHDRRLLCRTCLGMRYGEMRTRDERHEEKCRLEQQREAEVNAREAEHKAKQREYNRQYKEDMQEGLPHLERAIKALARSQRIADALKRMKL